MLLARCGENPLTNPALPRAWGNGDPGARHVLAKVARSADRLLGFILWISINGMCRKGLYGSKGDSKLSREEEAGQMNLRVNRLCILGALLGVVSLFTAWAMYYQYDMGARVRTLPFSGYDLLTGRNWPWSETAPHPWTIKVVVAPLLLAIGTAIAFFSPLGGVLQIAGAMYFLTWSKLYSPDPLNSFNLSIGPFIGLIAGALALLSIVYTIRFHRRDGPMIATARFLSISRGK